jgi:hypothetical protein
MVLGLVIGGCSPEGKGVFCNGLQKPITVTITSSLQPTRSITSVIPPGEMRALSGLRAVDLVTITVDEPRTNFTRCLHAADPDHRYFLPGEHELYFLVTDGDVYRIPRVLRKRWQDHKKEIQVSDGVLPLPFAHH